MQLRGNPDKMVHGYVSQVDLGEGTVCGNYQIHVVEIIKYMH
jgi:hypothetical protein